MSRLRYAATAPAPMMREALAAAALRQQKPSRESKLAAQREVVAQVLSEAPALPPDAAARATDGTNGGTLAVRDHDPSGGDSADAGEAASADEVLDLGPLEEPPHGVRWRTHARSRALLATRIAQKEAVIAALVQQHDAAVLARDQAEKKLQSLQRDVASMEAKFGRYMVERDAEVADLRRQLEAAREESARAEARREEAVAAEVARRVEAERAAEIAKRELEAVTSSMSDEISSLRAGVQATAEKAASSVVKSRAALSTRQLSVPGSPGSSTYAETNMERRDVEAAPLESPRLYPFAAVVGSTAARSPRVTEPTPTDRSFIVRDRDGSSPRRGTSADAPAQVARLKVEVGTTDTGAASDVAPRTLDRSTPRVQQVQRLESSEVAVQPEDSTPASRSPRLRANGTERVLDMTRALQGRIGRLAMELESLSRASPSSAMGSPV